MFFFGNNQPNAWHDDVTASFGTNFWRNKVITTCFFQVTYYLMMYFLFNKFAHKELWSKLTPFVFNIFKGSL